MKHFKTADNSESFCVETGESDVYTDGRGITTGPQPNDYCSACYAAEPDWQVVTADQLAVIHKIM
jgi:hypothetical protein